jgi:hypothetical protein
LSDDNGPGADDQDAVEIVSARQVTSGTPS